MHLATKLAALVALLLAPVFAHERAEAGDYVLVVGQVNEPALPGMVNGLDLTVRKKADNTPVEGLEKTLQVEILAPSGQKRVYKFSDNSKDPLRLRARFGVAGGYTTTWILSAPGQYRVRIFGTINGTPVDVTVGGNTFLMSNPADFEVK